MVSWSYKVTPIDLMEERVDDPEDARQTALDNVCARGWQIVFVLALPFDSSKLFVVAKRPSGSK